MGVELRKKKKVHFFFINFIKLPILLDGILESESRTENWRMGIELKKEGCIYFIFLFF